MISDVEIENEIRASVAEFLERLRALVRKDILQSVARHLQVDIRAAGISIEPTLTPPKKPGRKPGRAPAPSRPAAPTRSKPARKAPTRAASRKKAAAPRAAGGASARAAVPEPSSPTPSVTEPSALAPSVTEPSTLTPNVSTTGTAEAQQPESTTGTAEAQQPESAAGAKEAEQAATAGTEPPAVAPPGSGDEIAEALLAHVEIEPGQGLEELALAMGTPAAELEGPIKKLVEENKITEEMRQGQAAYYPT